MNLKPVSELQKRLYSDLKKQARQLLKKSKADNDFSKYKKTFDLEFKKLTSQSKEIPYSKLLRQCKSADIILIGDFHTYPQSQRTALRILRQLSSISKPALGLEIATSDLQKYFNQYQSAKISEQNFLKKIKYHEKWGFPWMHYFPLFEYAQKNKIPLLALNRPDQLPTFKPGIDLQARDQWAAGILLDQLESKAKPLVALYGEYHLSPSHLPLTLQKISPRELKIVVIHQNQDPLNHKLYSPCIQLKKSKNESHYCIFSGTPWDRLQSLVNWLRDDPSEFADEDESLDPNTQFIEWAQKYALELQKTLKIKITADFSNVNVVLYTDPKLKKLPQGYESFFRSRERLCLGTPKTGATFYTPTLSTNSAAELAAIWLRRHLLPASTTWRDFANEQTWAYFVSLLINPKRKGASWKDLKNDSSLAAREALKLYQSKKPLPDSLKFQSHVSASIARLYGRAKAIELHEQILIKSKSISTVVKSLTSSP